MKKSLEIITIVMLIGCVFLARADVCPSKLRGLGACDTLQVKNDSDLMIITIGVVRPPLDSENSPQNLVKLETWTTDLFTNHQLRLLSDSTQVLPVPSQFRYIYGPVLMTKGTLVSVLDEGYILVAEYRPDQPQTGIQYYGVFRSIPGKVGGDNLFGINGKAVQKKTPVISRFLFRK